MSIIVTCPQKCDDIALPHTVGLVSHNLWLIPIPICAWPLGRVNRCADNLSQYAATDLKPSLVIVAVQEAWAFRTGILWIIIYIWTIIESWFLRFGFRGAHEPLIIRVLRTMLIMVVTLTAWLTAWLPLFRWVVWDPKLKIANLLKTSASLPWSVSGTTALCKSSLLACPPIWLDSGLLLSSSEPADESGFVPYERIGIASIALSGMLWARWGSLGVINTHMTFENGDDGVLRKKQHKALASLVASFIMREGLCKCEAVIVMGDLNHALSSQTTRGKPGKAPSGMDREPSQYLRPWLPEHADILGLLDSLRMDGMMRVTRLSGDDPTNEDGTVDHILVVTLASAKTSYESMHIPNFSNTVADENAEISDHLLIKSVLRRVDL